ncbi:MAG: 4Fe-4S dicluster domain-containing protein [Syntrophomonadaceae bacterium]|nr:4Fe-4S dicluster domain-containing protein [Syntrophomonadaceae bacterium]
MDSPERKSISRRKLLKIGALATATIATGLHPILMAGADNGQDIPQNPNQIGFVFNQELCIGCRSCMAACKKTNNWEEGTMWRRVLQFEKDRIHLSISCNHCEEPACVTACPVKAYTKREKDGIVIHDPDKCVGCKYCLYVCPYHAPQFSEHTGRISKCSFCYERLENGEQPACISACPTGALSYGKLIELRTAAAYTEQPKGLPDPKITKPSWVIIPKA